MSAGRSTHSRILMRGMILAYFPPPLLTPLSLSFILDFPSYPTLFLPLHHTITGLSYRVPFTVHPYERRTTARSHHATRLRPLVPPLEAVSSLVWLPSNRPFLWRHRPLQPGRLRDIPLAARLSVAQTDRLVWSPATRIPRLKPEIPPFSFSFSNPSTYTRPSSPN
jgi:hypothetical protein